eukprot:7227159-Pyramimonas_sp.AAC.1
MRQAPSGIDYPMKVAMPRCGGLPLDRSPQVQAQIFQESIGPKCKTTSSPPNIRAFLLASKRVDTVADCTLDAGEVHAKAPRGRL